MTNHTIEIADVTAQSLREKKFSASFPEYYALVEVTENGSWHKNQNVLDHVIAVYAALEQALEFADLQDQQKQKLEAYLAQPIGNQTRKNILKVATLLHDIAKTDVLIQRPDGTANCPAHELVAAARVKNFAQRFTLDAAAEAYVERIVRYHGFISEMLSLMIVTANKEKFFAIFLDTVTDVALELAIFMRADLSGSDLNQTDPEGFTQRMSLLQWMLNKLVDRLE